MNTIQSIFCLLIDEKIDILINVQYSKNILILIDDRDQFYSSIKELGGCMNIGLIKTNFEKFGYSILVKGFSQINFKKENYSDFIVLYQSTDYRGPRSKI